MMLANVLRGTGVIIAVLGLIDPAIRLPWNERPRVAVRLADVPGAATGAQAIAQASPSEARSQAMLQRVRERFARDFTLAGADDRFSSVDATIIVGPADADLPVDLRQASAGRGALVAILPAVADSRTASATPDVRITQVAAPRRAHVTGRVRLDVALDARGLRGRRSTIAVRAEGLTLARTTYAWTRDEEQARVAIDVTPIREGIALFSVVVTEAAPGDANDGASPSGNATPPGATPADATPTSTTTAAKNGNDANSSAVTGSTATGNAGANASPAQAAASASAADAAPLARADVAVRVTADPLRILFVEPRPSWTTRFIRLALSADPRFRVDAQSQVSRGLAARTAEAPARLTAEALAPFDAVIVGAPDQLGAPDVEALRSFAHLRGGLIVFAPDRLPQGAYADLLPAAGFDERLLEGPQLVSAPDDASLGDMPLLASELALPRELRAGATTLARVALQPGTAPRPVIVSSPLGDGQVLFAGAMDAWRFRNRPEPRFEAFWRQIVFALGAQAPPPVELTVEPQAARPGEPVTLRAVWRRDLVQTLNGQGPASVRAQLDAAAAAGAAGNARSDARPGDQLLRLWPADRPGEFRAALNAPAAAGVYAMSLSADSTTPVRAPLLVSADVHRPVRSWEALRARVDAHGGLVVPEDRIDPAVDQLRRQLQQRPAAPAPRHPWRSAWWIVPFAGCLGGEWLLRRRRGEA